MSDKKKTVNPGATNPGGKGPINADGVPKNVSDAVIFTQRFVQGIIEAPLSLKEMLERNKRGR